MAQFNVKPTRAPTLPTTYTLTLQNGNTTVVSVGAGIAGKAFDARVTEHGDQWVAVNGPVVVGGIGPTGNVIPQQVDSRGNPVGIVPANSTSAAYETSRLVKATSGTLYGFSGYNSKSSAQFILVFDYAGGTVPPNTTSIPVVIIPVAAASGFSYDPGKNGRAFSAGIWITNSSTANTLTLGSADCFFDAQVI